jgi:hypothetical protein
MRFASAGRTHDKHAHVVLVFYARGNGRASVLEYLVVANVSLALGIKRIIAPAGENVTQSKTAFSMQQKTPVKKKRFGVAIYRIDQRRAVPLDHNGALRALADFSQRKRPDARGEQKPPWRRH